MDVIIVETEKSLLKKKKKKFQSAEFIILGTLDRYRFK